MTFTIPTVPSLIRRRPVRLVLYAATVLGLVSCADLPVGRAIRVGTASTSHTLCANHFIGHQPIDTIYREEIAPDAGMKLIGWALKVKVDEERREVRTT